MRHFSSKARWLVASLAIAYIATIAANGLRIFVSAHLWDATIYRQWVTPEQMHRLAGTVIYYASLLGLYFGVSACLGRRAPSATPLLWYIGISLGVPLAGRIFTPGTPGFAEHAAWVIATTLVLTAVKFLPSLLRNRIHLTP
jgi:exosortase/archaeosortase family protein